MPQQEDAHLEPGMQTAIFTYSLRVHFSSPSCTQMTHWIRGRTPGAAGGPIDTQQSLAMQGSACSAVDWWKAQNNLKLVTAPVTPSLTQHLARLEQHQQIQQPEWSRYWIFRSSVVWVLSILLSDFKLTCSGAELVYCVCLNCCEIVICICFLCLR